MLENNSIIHFYRRGVSEVQAETVLGEGAVRRAYESPLAKLFQGILFHNSLISRLFGLYCDSPLSKRRIQSTIRTLDMDESEFLNRTDSFATFNEFFYRHLRPESRPYDRAPEQLVAPADGRYLLYPQITGQTVVPVKGRSYRLDALLADSATAIDYTGGDVLVVRLCPADYHRFHFPCAGRILAQKDIPGRYHSVNPIALAKGIDIFPTNKRAWMQLDCGDFGDLIYMEVGAFGVGGIVGTTANCDVRKMEEKGYFKFGGSTLVLVFQPGKVNWAEDLLMHSAKGYETLLKVGETIGSCPGAESATSL
ncbi:MAG: phosphatidylserine decarboxylase [Rhodothermales bacterium]|jgi:phosphatidylserine decarboxylase